ncbi:MAG: flagellar filament capping protein FliD [Gammaproteobacteria bacterium]|nr:flagellar filament capping protein FliD [Gammaproteobacteria bacterium]
MAAISSLGVGSGLDLGSLVSGLIESERAPVANRLAVKEQNLTAELSAFGLLRSSLAQFQFSLSGLQSATAFNAKDISLSNDSVFSAAVENFADVGSYSVEVTALAKAQSLASNAATAFTTVDDVVGEGTLTIQFGTTATVPYSFTPDAGQSPQVIDVSAANGNNTLSGLRDYINDNDFDVQASIVNDGSGYRLVLTSERTGALNSMEITVTGDGDGNNNDNSGLSQLAFNASAQTSLSQTVAAQDAALSINGLDITRDTNEITGAINGVTLDLLKADVGNIVNVDVSESRSQITGSINGFVEAYNQLVESIDSLTAYNPETGSGSILIGDFTVRSISSQIRNEIFGRVSGLDGSIKSLVDIGITTNSSGTLDVDAVKLAQALQDHGSEVEALFAQQGRTTDPGISYVSATEETIPGEYAVNVTSFLTQGVLTGTDPVTSLTVTNNSNNLTLLVDGYSTGNITLTNATYADEAALASEIQSQINAASTLVTNGVSVTVNYNASIDRFEITSDSIGAGSSVEITAIDPQVDNRFGLTVGSGVDGTDFVGSINGQPATAEGNIITSQLGDSKGLSIAINSAATGNYGTVSLTRGIAGSLDAILDRFLRPEGFIASRESSISEGLDEIEDERFKLDDRITALEARLIRQFSALDALVAQFNQTSSFLSQQLANLPKPNSIGGNNS